MLWGGCGGRDEPSRRPRRGRVCGSGIYAAVALQFEQSGIFPSTILLEIFYIP